MVRMASELESNCVAIERIFEYANLESEDWKSDKESSAEQFSWVKDGQIQFKNYHTRYREGLQNVLKNVNLTKKWRQPKIFIMKNGLKTLCHIDLK